MTIERIILEIILMLETAILISWVHSQKRYQNKDKILREIYKIINKIKLKDTTNNMDSIISILRK